MIDVPLGGPERAQRYIHAGAPAAGSPAAGTPAAGGPTAGPDDRYKWVALSNTTAAVFMSALDGSIVIIALPAIFRGIHLDPLAPGNVSYRSTRSTAPMGRCG